MAGLEGISIVDTMIGFAAPAGVDREIPQVKAAHRGSAHTADYMFTEVPDDDPDDPITATLTEMDRHGVGVGLVNTGRPEAIEAARRLVCPACIEKRAVTPGARTNLPRDVIPLL